MERVVDRGLRRAARLALGAALGKRLPTVSGTLSVPGVSDPITIHRDGFGIPHIRAKTDHDAFFGLGFCHAQDRAGQLEITLRTVRGSPRSSVAMASPSIGSRAASAFVARP